MTPIIGEHATRYEKLFQKLLDAGVRVMTPIASDTARARDCPDTSDAFEDVVEDARGLCVRARGGGLSWRRERDVCGSRSWDSRPIARLERRSPRERDRSMRLDTHGGEHRREVERDSAQAAMGAR